MTAATVLAALRADGCRVAAAGGRLAVSGSVPAGLGPPLRVLQSGVRAALAGVPWYGCDGRTGRVVALDPAAPIPPGVTLVAAAGDARWDRLPPAARADLPALFAG